MAAASRSTASGLRPVIRTLLGPRWLAMHALVWAAVVVMVELGWWQLRVSNRKHFDLQNFSYVLQWWAFAAFTVAFWLRAMYNVRHPPVAATPGGALVLRAGSAIESVRRVQAGPADLVAPTHHSADAAVYRGYVIPQSANVPHRSEGDSYHASYNDYLWQLSLADAAGKTDRPTVYQHPEYPQTDDTPAQPARPELLVIEAAANGPPEPEKDRTIGA